MVKKKAFQIMFVILVVITLAACNSSDGDSETGSDGAANKITLFQSKVEIVGQLEELASEYEEETGVEVEVWGATGGSYNQQLLSQLNSDQGPTILSVNEGSEAEQIESFLYDMSDQPYVEHIAPDMELEMNGNLYGIPFGVEGYGLVYNKDMVSPEDITDYESFNSVLEDFAAEDIDGLSLSQEAYFLIGHIFNTPFALQEDPVGFVEQLNNGEVSMSETEEFQEFAQFMESIRANTSQPLEITYDTQIGNFATEQAAMIHQGNWAYGMFADYDLDFEMDMMPLPLSGNDKIAVGIGNYWGINNEASDSEIEAANDFMDWLITSETGHRYIVEELGFIPALTNIDIPDGTFDPLSQTISEATTEGETIPWVFYYFPTNIIDNDIFPAAQDFFLNEDMTGEQFLENLDQIWADVAG